MTPQKNAIEVRTLQLLASLVRHFQALTTDREGDRILADAANDLDDRACTLSAMLEIQTTTKNDQP